MYMDFDFLVIVTRENLYKYIYGETKQSSWRIKAKTFLNHKTFSIYLSYYFLCVISFIYLPFTNGRVVGYFCGVVGS